MAHKANCLLIFFVVFVYLSYNNQKTSCYAHVCSNRGVNIALNMPTAQSSTGWHGWSWRAVDGNTDGNYHHKSCTHTNNYNPWWRVDFGSAKRVRRVIIYNRLDCCHNRLNHFTVRVGNSLHHANNRLCGSSHQSLVNRADKEIYCWQRGRYLSIQLHGAKWLTLCEVKVFSF